ncbi:MAG: chromosome segregation protein SMC [Bacteroidota bacterium]|nr:chromosome segregation protein SMC [Bacteroidota bacterium]
MQLTKLEIKGFKSFGDQAIINFDEGITGIVGPNGCGKSNIVDAIRWVLGEQKTKALRSEKMENVIFNGTRTRKATQLAEVSLTFNNTKNLLPTEYSHITITRRFYRSGESEYILNGISCRLKDITNLFLDTGIASNSYAIIELKMVDDILNDKDNSRRGLFEEAAGISKFKIRKKETLKKLEETDEDLHRVEDLLFEINKNLKSLEKQARQAEKYFQLKNDYKIFSLKLAMIAVSRFNETLENIQAQLSQENDHKNMLNNKATSLEASLMKFKTEIIEKEKLLSSRQKTLNEQVNKIRQFESEKKIRNERLHYLQEKGTTLSVQIEQDLAQKDKLTANINNLALQEASALKQLTETETILGRYKESLDSQKAVTEEVQKEALIYNSEFRKKQEAVFQLQKALEIKEVQLSSLKQEFEKTTNDASLQSANINDFEKKIKGLEENVNFKKEDLHLLLNKEADIQKEIIGLQESIELHKELLSVINRKLDAKKNEYNLTKSLVDNLEGFPEATKFLKKNAQWGNDAPLLSDILTCEDRYKVTIENYLELYMNYFIVDVEAQAYEAINILKEASKGKASFFILESFSNFTPSVPTQYLSAIYAKDIVEYEEKYSQLISFILDRVYILHSPLQEPIEHLGDVFIFENGTLTKKLHSISGGAIGLFEGKRLGRAKNLEKLEKNIKDLRKEHDEKIYKIRVEQETLASLKASTEKVAIERLNKEIEALNLELISYKTRYEQFTSQFNNHELRREDILERTSDYIEELKELKPKLENEKQSQYEIENKIQICNDTITNHNTLLSQYSTSYNQQNILYYQHKNNLSNIAQELGFKKNAFSGAESRLFKNKQDLQNNENDIKKLLNYTDISEDELLNLYLEKDAVEEGLNEAEKEYYAFRENINSQEKEIRELQRGRENSDTLILNYNNKQNEIKLNLNSIKERISVEFEIDLDTFDGGVTESRVIETGYSEIDLKEKIKVTKEKLEKIGPVNLMAVDAYEEIKQRNEFITSQRDDLLKAKESLKATIFEIDTVAKNCFLEAYTKIKENFIIVFRSLFTEEDDCDLKITDPLNPLESSIDIIAKPKGKKPLTINQLSGGEKTLTAISLLFAIYLLKPAPFCIFDEVDAPLDDANIDKFNHIIKKFSKESQFIIVTHNKRTMSSTDVIYGITMIEQGVSRVIPVDLRALA